MRGGGQVGAGRRGKTKDVDDDGRDATRPLPAPVGGVAAPCCLGEGCVPCATSFIRRWMCCQIDG